MLLLVLLFPLEIQSQIDVVGQLALSFALLPAKTMIGEIGTDDFVDFRGDWVVGKVGREATADGFGEFRVWKRSNLF